jgi:dipeptide/tripeptide permease
VLMHSVVGGFGMGLADRWGRQKTIIYYSIISIIGEYR